MSTLLRLSCVVVLAGSIQVGASPSETPDYWSHIQSLAEPDTPEQNLELIHYVKSLTPDELLTAARQGCVAGRNKPSLTLEWERAAAAQSNALLCFEFYFSALVDDEGGGNLLNVMTPKLINMCGDQGEALCLRCAIVARIASSPNTTFTSKLRAYVDAHLDEVDAILNKILGDPRQNALLRQEAMHALSSLLGRQVGAVCRLDPNVREMRKHTNKALNVGELVRSGELALSEDTIKALKPIAARIRANVKLLGAILADKDKEPESLRKHARRKLEAYHRSALTQLDDEIAQALQEAGE